MQVTTILTFVVCPLSITEWLHRQNISEIPIARSGRILVVWSELSNSQESSFIHTVFTLIGDRQTRISQGDTVECHLSEAIRVVHYEIIG
jgi:hypothetical protein